MGSVKVMGFIFLCKIYVGLPNTSLMGMALEYKYGIGITTKNLKTGILTRRVRVL
ncbi:hypothetical protein APHWI1_1072 [Anaplasma phagocytophilum str. ApWI1]|uniref:Uncharacterized protein n=2 Tax=Anaplasma phagocytophilum TaxID=948 RepID=A0A0F3NJN8_ANAPH|nr:hypothetical protein EPHNCH_0282 [Anaplasma phagocytophilum str. NCH-1]KJV84581.1 hypothetical protein APHWI1_1072 [Anaplasma phagocytophilum str. ApWI1]KKA00204.1 hypothetical protein APHDU1_0828 [Anaplasma phagocytophilum]